MKQISVIIFDLDGVLVDATEWHYEALNRALAHFGYTIPRYDHLTSYNGLPTQKKLEMLSVEKGLPRALHSFVWKLKQKYTTEEIFVKCAPSFSAEMLTKRLRRDGYRLAVCSNSTRRSVDLMLTRGGLLQEFELYLSNEDVKNPKPDPEIYFTAFHRLGIKPQQVVIVEDAGPGIEAARRSGAHVCEVTAFEEVDYRRISSFIQNLERTINAENSDAAQRSRPSLR